MCNFFATFTLEEKKYTTPHEASLACTAAKMGGSSFMEMGGTSILARVQ